MTNNKEAKFKEVIHRQAAEFVQQESNGQSMITITKVELDQDFQKAIIFVTVFPDHKQNAVLDFLKRQRSEFKHFIKSKTKLSKIPQFDFMIDLGEKSRQRVEEII